jgi:hypothetical protein
VESGIFEESAEVPPNLTALDPTVFSSPRWLLFCVTVCQHTQRQLVQAHCCYRFDSRIIKQLANKLLLESSRQELERNTFVAAL